MGGHMGGYPAGQNALPAGARPTTPVEADPELGHTGTMPWAR